MIILGLDIATTTGFAWYDTSTASLSSINTGLLEIVGSKGMKAEEKAAAFSRLLISELHDYKFVDGQKVRYRKPLDFVAIEAPMRNIQSYTKGGKDMVGETAETTVNPNQMQLIGLICAATAIIDAYGLPWATIPSSTWRKQFLGYGRKPGFESKDWKKAAMERCQMLKIPVKKHDAAEAVGIAFAASGSQQFKMLQRQAA